MTKLQKAIDKNRKDAEALEQTAQWALDNNVDRFNELAYDIDIYENRVSVELWPDQLKTARRLLGAGWVRTSCHKHDATGALFYGYTRKNELKELRYHARELTLMVTANGNKSCQRVKTGTKTVDTYTIVCEQIAI